MNLWENYGIVFAFVCTILYLQRADQINYAASVDCFQMTLSCPLKVKGIQTADHQL